MFRCLCFVSTPQPGRSKFHSRAQSHVFLGYAPTQKGYKVLNLETNHITVSKDVVFHEQHFPFYMKGSHCKPLIPFFLPFTKNIDYTLHMILYLLYFKITYLPMILHFIILHLILLIFQLQIQFEKVLELSGLYLISMIIYVTLHLQIFLKMVIGVI